MFFPISSASSCPFPVQYTRKGNNASDGQALLAFARGLAGGAPGLPRSKYLFDAVNLPQAGKGGGGAGGSVPLVCARYDLAHAPCLCMQLASP